MVIKSHRPRRLSSRHELLSFARSKKPDAVADTIVCNRQYSLLCPSLTATHPAAHTPALRPAGL